MKICFRYVSFVWNFPSNKMLLFGLVFVLFYIWLSGSSVLWNKILRRIFSQKRQQNYNKIYRKLIYNKEVAESFTLGETNFICLLLNPFFKQIYSHHGNTKKFIEDFTLSCFFAYVDQWHEILTLTRSGLQKW